MGAASLSYLLSDACAHDLLCVWETHAFGPRDANTQDSLGGKYYYTGSAELSFPLGLPKELGLLGKAFFDIGSLWGPEETTANVLDSQKMRAGTGVGIGWQSPFGPIRVDYAIPVSQESWDRTENLRFSFGARF